MNEVGVMIGNVILFFGWGVYIVSFDESYVFGFVCFLSILNFIILVSIVVMKIRVLSFFMFRVMSVGFG